ncbi:uncharacterized protein LOC125194101 isoform X2 [Salvia hispanica]|uniref:uncharacterized protein LOC125194101 isoform X2 n=1 Tax=Salvia hispanica TaxID=49212 RepID=UPI002009D826|nr:uncharacterized protein LOC125194101 isoform X2 [Salvia hispanica]
MAQDVEAQQDKPSNACCAKLQKKHSKLLERCAKLEQIKNKFRDCTLAMQQRCDVVERDRESLRRDNESLMEASEKLKVQVNLWNSEKDIEAGRRADLEVQLLKRNSGSASRRGDEQLRIAQAEEEIKLLKELLDRERGKAASEKKRTELEKKKADEALKKLESVERKKAEEYKLLWEKLQKENDDMKPMLSLEKSRSRNAEKQKASIGRQRVDLAVAKPEEQIFVAETSLQNDRADDLNRKLEQARKRVEQLEGELLKHKCSEESKDRLLLEMLKKETDDLKSLLALEKSKSEAAHKKLEAEKQKTIRERKRADSAVAQKRIAEKCLEKDQADDLNRKLEQAKNRVEQLEDELLKHKCCEKSEDRLLLEKSKKETDDLKSMLALEKSKSEDAHKKLEAEKQKTLGQSKRAKLAVDKSKEQINLAEANLKKAMYEKARADDLSRKLEEAKNRADKSSPSRNAVTATDIRTEMLKNDTHFHKWVEKMLLEKEHDIVREKKRADSAKKKAKKQIKVAEEYKKISMEQKDRADQLSGQLETYKLRLEGLQKEMQAFVSLRIYAGTSPMINDDVIYETDTVELLKKQLKLEKLLAKHAKEATKIEALRNTMLRQELCHLKQESVQFQKHMNILLDKSFLHGPEGIDQLKKIGSETTKREVLGSDGSRRRVMSGIDSRMDPPYRGSNQKMLQSSAIYSSSASFSDRPLVGSQERDTFSIMTSANLGEDISNFKPKIPNKMQSDQNVAKADNRTSSPIKDSSSKRRLGLRQKKRNLGAVESIENLHGKGEKLHQHVSENLAILHDTLNGQVDDSQEESLKGTTYTEFFRPLKKRKPSSEGTVIVDHLQNSGESKGTDSSDINNSDPCVPASSPGSDAVRSDLCGEDGTNNILEHNMSTSPDFDQIVTGDHMKLLDMDNAADEDSYHRAIARPLSPTLAEVEVVSSEMLACRSSQLGLSTVSRYPVIEMEKNLTNVAPNGSDPLLLQMEHNSDTLSENTTPSAASDTHCQEIHVTSGMLGTGCLSCPGNEGTIETCEKGSASSCGEALKCFIVLSDNKDNLSILRILQTISSFMPQYSFDHSVETFVQNVIHTISKAKDLSTREKACVFLSLILPEISELGLKNLKILGDNFVQALASVTTLFNSALSDPSLKRMAMESCGLFELLAIIEDFLQQSKIFVYGGVYAESESHVTSKLDLILNGNPIMLLEVAASAHLLIAGGSLLASLCLAVDDIGYVCEISYNIIRTQKLDRPVMLAILHAFALICGSKYFTLQHYSVAMTVVKSVVMFLEEQTLSASSTSLSLSDSRNPSSMLLCTHCPFSEGAVSVENAAVMLLENLQKQCHCGLWPQDSLALVSLLVPTLPIHEEGDKVVSGSGETASSSLACDETLCNFLDIFSLVEVLASVMSWKWTSDNIIGPICQTLKLNLTEGFSATIITLLGQLGRLGVGAGGYDDPGVQKLRDYFSNPIKFEEITEDKTETPATTSSPYSFVREWFFSLSHDLQSSLRPHFAASQGN